MVAIVLVGGKHLLNPLIPVAKQPFLYWLTLWLKSQGLSHIVYSASTQQAPKIEAFAQHLMGTMNSLCIDVITESRPLGTGGGAALCAQRFPSNYTLVVNGNSILLSGIRPAFKKLQQSPSLDGIIFGANVTNAGRFGTLEVDAHHQLSAFKEKQPGKGSINAGVYLLKNELLQNVNPDKESSLECDCFPAWLKMGKSFAVMDNHAPFIDIGTPETLKKAHEMVLLHQPFISGQQGVMVA